MALPTPDTARVVAMVSDHAMRLRVRFLADDGRIDDGEQALLDDAEEIGYWAQEADDGRQFAIAVLNVNEITAWQRRKWRDRHRDLGPKAA